jgi:hypothetical protein
MTTPGEPAMDDARAVSFIGRPLSSRFERRVLEIPAGAERTCDGPDWDGMLAVVEAGELEVEGVLGARRTFRRGAVLCLDRVPCRLLRNPGAEPAVVTAVRRRRRGA